LLLKSAEFEQKDTTKKVFNLSDIAEEAREIIAAARRHGESLRKQTEAECKEQLEQARREGNSKGREEGFAQGREEGMQQALEEARGNFARESAETLGTLQQIITVFDQVKQSLLWRAEQDTVVLSLAIAEKVIHQRVSQKEKLQEITAANVKETLELVTRNTNVIIKVNPETLEYLEAMASKNKQELSQYQSIRWEADESITPGGCVMSTNNGKVDGQIETQINRISEQLLSTIKEEEGSSGPVEETK